jgi:nitrile hydratase accessory protein
MTISNPFDSRALAGLPPIPADHAGPLFAEPWEEQAFSLAVELSAQGHFTWKEWTVALADEFKAAADRGKPDDGSRYYHHWLAALERLVIEKGLADRAGMDVRKEAWIHAYVHTPNGRPVELAADPTGDTHQ